MHKVAIFPIPATGHVNPLLAVVEALAARPDIAAITSFGPAGLARAFAGAGATHVTVPNRGLPGSIPGADAVPPLSYREFVEPLGEIADALRLVRELDPDVVLYDVFSIQGLIAAQHLGIPSAALVTFPGFGALGDTFLDVHGRVTAPIRAVNAQYVHITGVDVIGAGMPPVLFPSPDACIVTTLESLAVPLTAASHPRLHAALASHLPPMDFVGPCLPRAHAAPASARATPAGAWPCRLTPFPFAALDEAQARGRRIILFSLGTVITDFRFDTPVGGAPSGRAFLRRALNWLIDACGDDPNLLLVVAVGSRLDPADEPSWPANFVVRDVVPQRTLLARYADAFITHHGANSTAESVLAGVPMISCPGVGDQLAGARIAIDSGTAACFWSVSDVFGTCTAALLRRALDAVLFTSSYRERCRTVGGMMAAARGAAEAARLVVALAAGGTHEALHANGRLLRAN